ncbi:MAG: heme ABC exporter ATP-binding protein CcmA [Reyranellaceae bacterium]
MAMFQGHSLACHRGGRTVFAGLGFALERGEALLLRGSNGSGKSSLLRVLALLTPLRTGSLEWAGGRVDEDRDAHRSRLRFLGHADALKPALTVRENLDFAARLADPDIADSGIDRALELVGLDGLAALPARLLSAGQRRRLALARLAASAGELWLLDEPGTGLDAASLRRLHELIADHRRAGGIVIASTHGDLAPPGARTLDLDALAEVAES